MLNDVACPPAHPTTGYTIDRGDRHFCHWLDFLGNWRSPSVQISNSYQDLIAVERAIAPPLQIRELPHSNPSPSLAQYTGE